MQNTLTIFNDRKNEIEFYFSALNDINNGYLNIKSSDNSQLFKIMKSNFLLMLYNLIEACITSGITEIYENLKNENCTYNELIIEIQQVWLKHKINDIYGVATQRTTYEKRMKQILDIVNTNTPIILYNDKKNILDMSGNLDARKIRSICDKHKIRYRLKTKGEHLELIKRERNSLSHGDISFSDCARDLTIKDLEEIKNEVMLFLSGIINGMEKYYNEKQYKRSV